MGRVKVLEPLVAERIAAGEVIERPASVVKELVENSLDAGATEICVRLEAGGRALIEVTDNGSGILAEDLGVAVQRHATSKLRAFEDLESLNTLGFRGEALPSVAAVSELRILSRAQGFADAHELLALPESQGRSSPQPTTFGHFLGSEHGTRISAQGLFSQMPARLKFLKSPAAEVSQVREWLERLALTHPETGFELFSEERRVLRLRPEDRASRVRSVLADGEDYPIVEERIETPVMSGSIYWLQGMSLPSTKQIVQVVNGRALRDRLLQQALMSSFRQALLPGQFPAVALFLDIEPRLIDANVHPTKTEIRFLDSGAVFRAVSKGVEKMVGHYGAPAFAAGASAQALTTSFAPMELPLARTATQVTSARHWGASEPSNFVTHLAQDRPSFSSESTAGWNAPTSGSSIESVLASPPPVAPSHPFDPNRYVGVFFQTYLAYDLGTELGLIDQHAAHERVRFEELRKRALLTPQEGTEAPSQNSQSLLIPETAPFPIEQRAELEVRLPWLSRLGFDAELFGEDQLVFRGVPAEWGQNDLRVRLKALVERLLAIESLPESGLMDENLFERLASEACHSAVRAGDRLDRWEATSLVDALFLCEHPWNCPHGRPTVVRVPRARFEEWFQRRV